MATRLPIIAAFCLLASCASGGPVVTSTGWADHLGSPCDAVSDEDLMANFGVAPAGEYGADPSDIGNPMADHVQCEWRSGDGLLLRLTFVRDPEATAISENLTRCQHAGLVCTALEPGTGAFVVTTEPGDATPWCPSGPGCRGGPSAWVALDAVALTMYAPPLREEQLVELTETVLGTLP